MRQIQKIVLVDDDMMINMVTERLLLRHNQEYQITVYTNPVKALEALKKEYETNNTVPDIILLDIRMPELTGFEFLEKLNENDFAKNIQVIMHTSSFALPDQERAQIYSNVIGYMQKPFSVDLFSKILQEKVQC